MLNFTSLILINEISIDNINSLNKKLLNKFYQMINDYVFNDYFNV